MTSSSNDETRLSTDAGSSSPSGRTPGDGAAPSGRFAEGDILDGRYRIAGLVGRGGMGEVYRAEDLRLHQAVAIKLLPAGLGHDPKRLAQFHNEVRVARQVSHPNVCRVHDIGDVDGQLFLTMEFVDGEDLAAVLKRGGRLPEERALEFARQISAGLAAAHDRGIIHRDLKPANIMVDRDGRVRLMDFGLAAVGGAEDIRAGTPAYMSPEQLGGTSVSLKSDIFALGLVLYELFTGKRAFSAKTLQDLVDQHKMRAIAPPRDVVPTLDPAIDAVIMRCLDHDAANRPVSALAVSAALPGGDPLAAAIAAGETPSPEMVAAAGKSDPPWPAARAAGLTAAVLALLFAAAWLCDRTTFISKLALDYAPATLADRARDLERQFGFTGGVDRASGIAPRLDVITWLRRDGRNRQLLAGGGPTPLVNFWYRSGSGPLVPAGAAITMSDPQEYQPGMTSISMDSAGRLLAFSHVPSPADAPAAGGPPPWDALFVAAGLDRSTFVEAAPQSPPQFYADARAAWTGSMAGAPEFGTIPVRIEASAAHGRPVSFSIVGPWNDASAAAPAPDRSTSLVATIATVIVIPGVILAAAIVARANVRGGRGDRRGAIRIGTAVLAVFVGSWIFSAAHFRNADIEVQRFFQAVGQGLFAGGTVWLFYLAAEPRVRKIWPHMLITWSRLIGGSTRDPLIGRDLIVGTLAGTAMTVVSYAFYLVPEWLNWPLFTPHLTKIDTLGGVGPLVGLFFTNVSDALQNAMLGVVGLALLRGVVKREFAAFLAATVIFTPLAARGQFQSGIAWLDLIFGALLVVLILGVLYRFGLFAGIVGFTAHFWTFNVPITTDATRVYFSASLAALAIVAGLAIAGFILCRTSRKGPLPAIF